MSNKIEGGGRLPLWAVVLVLGIFVYLTFWAPNTFSGDRFITVSRGMTFKQVVDSLESQGILRSRTLFELAAKVLDVSEKVYVGKYYFRSGVSNHQILEDIGTGKSALRIPVTLSEGLRIASYAGILQRELGIDSARFHELATDPMVVRSLGVEDNSLEGYLLPETYVFSWQTDEGQVLERIVEEFKNFYNDSLKVREEELGMTTKKLLTLASIVEGEAIFDEERPIIAGVYYNRLRKRMRLEADPTIQFIIEDGPRRLRHRDLQIPSPYNTYRNYGLPPGPINNPGRASILATLYPAQHDYLFFVTDGKGGHIFSRNYSEHRRAVTRYRRILSRRI